MCPTTVGAPVCVFTQLLRIKCFGGAENYRDFQRMLSFFEIKTLLIKLRENGTIRDFPHDCGTADTYVLHMLT